MSQQEFIPINVAFNRFVGRPDHDLISEYIGVKNFSAIRDPAIKYRVIYIVCDASILFLVILTPLFLLLGASSHRATFWIMSAFMGMLCMFVMWVRTTRRGPIGGELKKKSPKEYYYQLEDLIDFGDRITSGEITLHVSKTAFSPHGAVRAASNPGRVSDDHGLLWIFGKERGRARPNTILVPFFEGELLVDASKVPSHLPKKVEEVLRKAALAPANVPKMPTIELDRLEQAMKIAGTWSDQIGAVMKLLHAYAALPTRPSIETATGIFLRENATPLQREGTRKVLGGRYKPLLNAILKTAQAFGIKGIPEDTNEGPDNQPA